MTSKTKFLVAGLLLLLAVVVTLQNVTVVRLHFLFWSVSLSQSLLLLLAGALGGAVGWIGGSVRPLPKSLRPR